MRGNPVLNETQIHGLKSRIFFSPDAGRMAKKILMTLVEESKGLSRPVYFMVSSDIVANDVDKLAGPNNGTLFNEMLEMMGTKYHFQSYEIESGSGWVILLSNFVADHSNAELIKQSVVDETKFEAPKLT